MISKKRRNAFTLVEVLVVVIILIIITTIAVMSYSRFQADARDNVRKTKASILSEALEKYYVKNGEYPGVRTLTSNNISQVKSILSITDSEVFVMPGASSTTINSITADTAGTSMIAYNGDSVDENEKNSCKTSASVTAGCDEFRLQWIDEKGEDQEIKSRHSGRECGANCVVGPPSNPVITASVNASEAAGTVSAATCSNGTTISYKIIVTTTEQSDPNFSSVSWQTSNKKSLSSPTIGETYWVYAIARCTSGSNGEAINTNIAEDSIYYAPAGSPSVVASWNGSNAQVQISISSACVSPSTPRYFIQYKIDTSSAAGTWVNASTVDENWVSSSSYTITNAAANGSKKYNFRAQVRCDNGATAGTANPSNISSAPTDYLISAPSAPTVSNSSTSTTTTWTWPATTCPVGTSVVYKGAYSGNYNAYPAFPSTLQSGYNITTTSQGFIYGLRVKASCGQATSKILSSTDSNDSTYTRPIPTMNFRTARAGMRTYNPSSASSAYVVYTTARVDTIQANSGVSASSAVCGPGTTRVIGWATSVNNGSWNPLASAAAFTKDERDWPTNTLQYFYYTSDLDDGDVFEARFATRCKNKVTGAYSPTSSGYKYDDRIGNIQLVNGVGRYHTLCDISDSISDSLKYPIWCSGGYTSDASSTGTCTLNGDGSTSKCWSKHVDVGAWTWSWSGGFPPSTSPNRRPSSTSWGTTD